MKRIYSVLLVGRYDEMAVKEAINDCFTPQVRAAKTYGEDYQFRVFYDRTKDLDITHPDIAFVNKDYFESVHGRCVGKEYKYAAVLFGNSRETKIAKAWFDVEGIKYVVR